MILKMNRKSKGRKGVVEYLLNQREQEGTAITLRGNPEITKNLIKSIDRKHKYLSGGLMFAREECINEKQKNEIMDAFEAILVTGIDLNQYNILWVEHHDKGRLELNFVVPRIVLTTGNDLDLYSHRRDLPIFDMWKNGINAKYKLADPNDPHRARTMSEHTKVSRNNGSIVVNRKNLDKALHKLVQNGRIKSREQMIELLKKSAYEITRKNSENISVKHEDIGRKALRLKGGIYSEDFTSIERINEETEQRARQHHNKVTSIEIGAHKTIYQSYLQTRVNRHQKRYSKVKQSSKQKLYDTQQKDKYNLDGTTYTKNKGIENDRIRELITTVRRRRKLQFTEFRKREELLYQAIKEYQFQFRTAEQKLFTHTQQSRESMEKSFTRDARFIDAKSVSTDSQIRANANRVFEVFKRVRKSIKGAVNETKKLKLFTQSRDEVLSKKRPTINLMQRR